MAKDIIQMYRGDTKDITIGVKGDIDTERLEDGDDIFLGIMEVGQDFEDAIIRRKLSYGDYSVEILDQQIVNFRLWWSLLLFSKTKNKTRRRNYFNSKN